MQDLLVIPDDMEIELRISGRRTVLISLDSRISAALKMCVCKKLKIPFTISII